MQTAITPPRIARLHSNLVQSLTMAQVVYYKWVTAMDRLSECDFKLALGDKTEMDRDGRGVGRPQVAMHRSFVTFSSYTLFRGTGCFNTQSTSLVTALTLMLFSRLKSLLPWCIKTSSPGVTVT